MCREVSLQHKNNLLWFEAKYITLLVCFTFSLDSPASVKKHKITTQMVAVNEFNEPHTHTLFMTFITDQEIQISTKQ